MSLYKENVAYKGLINVSPQIYANNLFTLPPGAKVVVEADIADRVYENAYPSLDYVDSEEVDTIVVTGEPGYKEVYTVVTTDVEVALEEEVTPNPPDSASSDVVEVTSPVTDDVNEEAPTLPNDLSSPPAEETTAPETTEVFVKEEFLETPTTEVSTFLESAPILPTTDDAPAPVTTDDAPAPVTTDDAPAPVTTDDAPKRPKLNKDK